MVKYYLLDSDHTSFGLTGYIYLKLLGTPILGGFIKMYKNQVIY